jgi:hypothetical protein
MAGLHGQYPSGLDARSLAVYDHVLRPPPRSAGTRMRRLEVDALAGSAYLAPPGPSTEARQGWIARSTFEAATTQHPAESDFELYKALRAGRS